MKVLHVIKQAGIAGAETYLLNILPELQKKGIECTFLALVNPSFLKEASLMTKIMSDRGITVKEVILHRPYSIQTFRLLARIIETGDYDLVHSHLIHAEFYMAMVKRFFAKDMVLASTKHGYYPAYQEKYGFEAKRRFSDPFWWITKSNSTMVDRYCTISHGLKNLIVQLGITSADKVDVIHYGFNYDAVQYDNENLGKYRKTPHQILIVGRLIPVKGHHFAFRALKEVLKKIPDASLVIIGSGPLEEELKRQVAEMGLSENVHFEGFQMNVHNYIKNSDLVLIPSYAEGFCAVVLEAYHNQTPVMAFDVPALNEIIQHEQTGIIVKKFDVEDLVGKILEVFKNPEHHRQLAMNGFNMLHSYFTMERMVNETIDFYKKTLTEAENKH